jgi:Putative transposase/Transposase zinc-binding domain
LARDGAVLRSEQRQALRDLAACRTAALGGHEEACDACGQRRFAYNSCRNRHCPKCQASARARWLDARQAELLDVPYFHVVFTLPAELGALALANERIVYGILFQAASETLLQIAAQPRHLGAKIGFLAVLHTWGQNLTHHPHLHCVIPAGGFSADGQQWIHGRANFFLPVRILSRVFRGKFIARLKQAFRSGQLRFFGKLRRLADGQAFERLLDQSVRTDWVVYAKPPFGGARQVLKYLARYTHRTAISNSRLTAFDGQRVSFQWKDYADDNRQKSMTLSADEFVRRFLMHVLPRGFPRIRYYGFLANRHRSEKVAAARRLIGGTMIGPSTDSSEPAAPLGDDQVSAACPVCGAGRIQRVNTLTPQAPPALGWLLPRAMRHERPRWSDTS